MKKDKQMKTKYIPTYIAAFFLFTAACPTAAMAQHSIPGGFASTSVTNKEVVAAAAFAIKAQEEKMPRKNDGKNPKIELVKILGAEQQVVAGMNYRLQLKIKVDGDENTAEAVVWWQAWRKSAPYQLTAWNWK